MNAMGATAENGTERSGQRASPRVVAGLSWGKSVTRIVAHSHDADPAEAKTRKKRTFEATDMMAAGFFAFKGVSLLETLWVRADSSKGGGCEGCEEFSSS